MLIAVPDLASAACEIEARFGLVSVDGGRHPGWGTANRIVPLGKAYVELVSVVDDGEAAKSAVGRWVAQGGKRGIRPLGWAVRTRGLDAVARRLGLPVRPGSRIAPDGTQFRWRSVGIEQAVAEPALPFFIEWDAHSRFPGRAAADHGIGDVELARVVLDGDAARLAEWLGEHTLSVDVRAGVPRVASIVLASAAGEIVLASDLL